MIKVIGAIILMSFGVINAEKPEFKLPGDDKFHHYWYDKGAEISRYKLEQARYGEIHDGDAVLVFVTEPFDPVDQVKEDNPETAKPPPVPVLKLNATRKFNTGIYPYSTMRSIFTPISRDTSQLPIKVTVSVQEWCGHVFSQLNSTNKGYHFQGFSYFQSEGDRKFSIAKSVPEDGIWTMIRIDPNSLPLGEFDVIPSLLPARLLHFDVSQEKATAKLKKADWKSMDQKQLYSYEISFSNPERKLTLYFEKDFPFRVEGWDETFKSGWGEKAKMLTTKARRTHTIHSFYWRKNNTQDEGLRKKLGLE